MNTQKTLIVTLAAFGAAAVLLAIGVAIFFAQSIIPPAGKHTDRLQQAFETARNSDCSKVGSITADGQYDDASKTWRFGMYVKGAGGYACMPTCVVAENGTATVDRSCPVDGTDNGKEDLIKVSSLKAGDEVSSPMTVRGEARGTWYFEASFPVKMLDASGKVLGTGYAQAQGEWMTENFVPFKSELTFQNPTTETGTLVLEKDNPSGLPQNADELRIPVRFKDVVTSERDIKLYFYNPSKDQDATGNVMCTRAGLVAVDRKIPNSITPIQDAIESLLKGELTAQEKAQGISTEFPLSGVELKSANLKDGVLTLEFSDPQNKTSGGSCRAGVLWYQIEATAKRFEGVQSVKFIPETLFQP